MDAPFQMPDLVVGDMVLFHNDPHSKNAEDAAMGWISQRPGASTVTLLVWAPNTGFVEKPSVRHVDDPFWRESETAAQWLRWGCFELHPSTKALKELKTLLTRAKLEAAKSK